MKIVQTLTININRLWIIGWRKRKKLKIKTNDCRPVNLILAVGKHLEPIIKEELVVFLASADWWGKGRMELLNCALLYWSSFWYSSEAGQWGKCSCCDIYVLPQLTSAELQVYCTVIRLDLPDLVYTVRAHSGGRVIWCFLKGVG